MLSGESRPHGPALAACDEPGQPGPHCPARTARPERPERSAELRRSLTRRQRSAPPLAPPATGLSLGRPRPARARRQARIAVTGHQRSYAPICATDRLPRADFVQIPTTASMPPVRITNDRLVAETLTRRAWPTHGFSTLRGNAQKSG